MESIPTILYGKNYLGAATPGKQNGQRIKKVVFRPLHDRFDDNSKTILFHAFGYLFRQFRIIKRKNLDISRDSFLSTNFHNL